VLGHDFLFKISLRFGESRRVLVFAELTALVFAELTAPISKPVSTLSVHYLCLLRTWSTERKYRLSARTLVWEPATLGAPITLGWCPLLAMRASLFYELISSAERNKQTTRGRSTQCTNNSDPITSTSELLLRQNSVTAHANQSYARRLASEHCATENNRSKSEVRPIHTVRFVCLFNDASSKLQPLVLYNVACIYQPCWTDSYLYCCLMHVPYKHEWCWYLAFINTAHARTDTNTHISRNNGGSWYKLLSQPPNLISIITGQGYYAGAQSHLTDS
jgi:hypothetical protein